MVRVLLGTLYVTYMPASVAYLIRLAASVMSLFAIYAGSSIAAVDFQEKCLDILSM